MGFEKKIKNNPIVPIIYSAIRKDSLMLCSDFSISLEPIYLPTSVAHACPTPIAGINDACMIVKRSWVVASSTIPMIDIIL